MGQNQFAEWFINTTLGWIRWVANGVAKQFQSNTSSTSSGASFMGWFGNHWLALLLTMIVAGVVIDWLVWMIRWRPYWVWFRKKRVLLDDDIEAILSDDELLKRYAPSAAKEGPHFTGSELGRGNRPARASFGEEVDELYDQPYDEAFDVPDIEDPYLDQDPLLAYDDEYEDDEDDDLVDERRVNFSAKPSDEDYERENSFDQLYSDNYSGAPILGEDDSDIEPEQGSDSEEPDISFIEAGDEYADLPARKRRSSKRLFHKLPFRRKSTVIDDDDPFSVDGDEFDDEDDDVFYSVVSEVQGNTDSMAEGSFDSLYEPFDSELSEELTPPRLFKPNDDAGLSRKARRQRRERLADE